MAASSYRYETTRTDEPLRLRLVELAREKPRFGYRRLHILLGRSSEHVNHKRVHRVYREAGLMIRRKKRKHCVRVGKPLVARTSANQEWALDFLHDGGFYKRGCQVKTLYPSQGGFVFLGIQPLPATPRQLRIVLFASPRISGINWRSFGLALSADKQLGGSMANHGSIRGSRLGAALWLCWVVRGSIWWPMRLIRLSRLGYLPSNPCAQLSNLRTSGLQLPDSWWCALMLLVASDVPLRTSLLSSTESGQSPPSCGPASGAPWPAASRWRLVFRRTRGTDLPSHWRSWRRS